MANMVKGTLNYVKNAGAAYADAIFETETENTDDFIITIEVYNENGERIDKATKQVLKGKRIYLRMPLKAEGKLKIKAQLCKSVAPEEVLSELIRETKNFASFADTEMIRLKEGSIFEKSEKTGLDYILGIDVDRLMAPVFEMHDIPTPNNAKRYGGWERKSANNWTEDGGEKSFTLAGESLGHWLSAAAVFYRDMKDTVLLEKMSYVIDKLDELQRSELGANARAVSKAYLGGCPEDTFIKCFEGNKDWINGYWVPWYNVHKVYQGLLDVYDYANEDTAIKAYMVLKRFADWAVDGTANLTDTQMQTVLDIEYGGMNEIFARMYEITGEEKYLKEGRRFTHDKVIEPLKANSKTSISGLHANTQIPKFVGAAELYEQDEEAYAEYRTACENFWHTVNFERGYVIGGNSIAEHFEQTPETETLGIKTCESCNTYNMMRLTEHVYAWNYKDENSKYMDWYERALYNHILGQQEPVTGAKMYFISLLQGHHRIYEDKYKSWWCCTGTGMENPGRYTRTAYFEDNAENTLYVNLYMAGEYEWAAQGLKFKVETEYPYSDTVKYTIIKADTKNAGIKFRAPKWASSNITAKVNGEVYSAKAGTYLTINRIWNTGDVIELKIPMSVNVYNSRTAKQIAFQYGAIVLAADLGSCMGVRGVNEYVQNETKLDSVQTDYPYIVTQGETDYASFIEEIDKSKLRFKIKAQNSSTGKEVELRPFFEIHHSFHNVYWDIDNEGDEYEKWLNSVQIDKVEPDGQQDEIGHELKSRGSKNGSMSIGGKSYYWRDAKNDASAYFQYTMTADKGKQNYLFVRYCGSDGSVDELKRDFKIYADDIEIARQCLNAAKPNEIYNVFYEIPRTVTDRADTVSVKFVPSKENCIAGSVLEVRITKENKT